MLTSREPSALRNTGISLLLVALLAACSGDKPEQFFSKAREQYEKGDRSAAVIQLKNAIQKDPDYADARLLLGKIYVEQGEGASAEKELRKAIQLGATRESVLPQIGRALLLQREFKKALEEAPASPGGTPAEAAAVLAVRGAAFAALKQVDEAKTAYEAARKLDPGLVEANQGLAMLALSRQQPEEAMRLAEDAIQKAGKRAEPWMLKADLLRAQGKNAEAAQAYEEALKRDPANMVAHLALASVLLQDKKFDAAQRQVDAAQKLEPMSMPVRLTQAQLDLAQKKYSQARDNLQEVLKSAPNHAPAVLMMGTAQLALGAYAQAEAYLSTYLRAAPQHIYARRLLAATYLKNKQPGKAAETLNPLLSAGTQDAAVLALAGEAYLQLKDYAKATEYLEKAAKGNPGNAALRTELAVSRVASGDVGRGTTELEAAADMENSPLQTNVALIYTYLSKQNYDKALSAIAAMEKKQANDPLVHNLRGATYVAKKDFPNARKAFEQALSINGGYYPAAMNLARLDMLDKNPQAARKRFDGVLAADKNNASAMVAIAVLEREAGHEKEFVEWLDKAARADVKAITPRSLLVQHYIGKNDAPRALSIAREAQTANPTSPEALDLLGNAQMAAGEKDNAIATYEKLTALAPDSPLAHFRLASAEAANKRLGDARKSLNKALELKPDLIDAQVSLIALDMQESHPADAIKRAQQIQQQQPKLPVGYAIEADIQSGQKQFAKAAELYQKAFDQGRNSILAMKLYGALVAAGKKGDAETKAAQWLKERPQDLALRLYLAENYMAQRDDKQAIAQYRAVLQTAPDNLIALNNLAWLLHKQGDAQGLTYAERAYKLRPEDGAIMDTYGWLLVEQGKTAQGLDLLQRALAKAPDASEIRYHLAVALHKNGNNDRAEAELKRLIDSGIKFPQEREAATLLAQIRAKR